MKAYLFPEYDTPIVEGKNVAVFGAGNVAMDSARTALRLGADNVHIIYRRSRDEMPARAEEVHHAEEEGVQFRLLSAPIQFVGDDKGRVMGVECLECKLGEPDESGRRRPVVKPGTEHLLEVDMVVYALGTTANPIISQSLPGLEVNRWGYITVDEETGMTSVPGVFAGGDIVTGSATVIQAMGAGRRAAAGMLTFLGLLEPAPV